MITVASESDARPGTAADTTAAAAAPLARRLRPLAALRPFLAPHRGLILLALLAMAVAAGAALVLPVAARQVIDRGFSQAESSESDSRRPHCG